VRTVARGTQSGRAVSSCRADRASAFWVGGPTRIGRCRL
jgi:hypothetical protein